MGEKNVLKMLISRLLRGFHGSSWVLMVVKFDFLTEKSAGMLPGIFIRPLAL